MRVKKTNPTPEQLSSREHAAMIFIENYLLFVKRAPTYRRISLEIDLSLSATHDLVKRLIEYGYLQERVSGWGRRLKYNLRVLRSVQSEKPIA